MEKTDQRRVTSVVVLDESPGMFPGVAVTSGGLVASYSTVPDGMPGGCIGTIHSSDGLSWHDPTIVVEPADPGEAAINQVGLRRLSNGELLMPFCRVRIVGGYAARQATLHMARSTDDGATWTLSEAISLDFLEPLTYGGLVEVEPGKLICPIWGRRREGERWRSAVIFSGDSGRTWSPESVTIGYDPNARLRGDYAQPRANALDENGNPAYSNISDPEFRPHADVDGFTETSIVALNDGSLLAILRQQGVGGDTDLWFYRSTSDDGGVTWSSPERLEFAGTSPALYVTRGGELLLGYRVFAPSELGVVPGVRVVVSRDRGITWGDGIDLVDPKGYVWTSEYQCGYPDFAEMEDGTLVVVFYSYDPELPHRRYLAANIIVEPNV